MKSRSGMHRKEMEEFNVRRRLKLFDSGGVTGFVWVMHDTKEECWENGSVRSPNVVGAKYD